MRSPQNNESIHASIHDIVSQNKKTLHKQQINQLFYTPELTEIDTSQFQHHSYMVLNELFTFFVHELQKWNKKVRNRQVTPFYHAQLSKYIFIHSSLKIISLKKPNQINRYLQQLSLWYSKNSYNIPQPSVLMKRYDLSQQWDIRKTFKSNTPSEINNYRRRFLCSPDEKNSLLVQNILGLPSKKENCFFSNQTTQKMKTVNLRGSQDGNTQSLRKKSQSVDPFRQLIQNTDKKLINIENNKIRRSRQDGQIQKCQNEWKKAHNRFGQKSCQNLYKGKFNHNKQFSEFTTKIQPRKIYTAMYNARHSQQSDIMNNIKKRRLQTSFGMRKTFASEEHNLTKMTQKEINRKTECNEEVKQLTTNWIDNFVVDEDKLTITNTFEKTATPFRLMSNPFDAVKGKMKKKKK